MLPTAKHTILQMIKVIIPKVKMVLDCAQNKLVILFIFLNFGQRALFCVIRNDVMCGLNGHKNAQNKSTNQSFKYVFSLN